MEDGCSMFPQLFSILVFFFLSPFLFPFIIAFLFLVPSCGSAVVRDYRMSRRKNVLQLPV